MNDQTEATGIEDETGVTFLELLVTLLVIGALTALILPLTGKTLALMEARAFVLQLETDLVYAQRHAIATERPVNMKVNQAGFYIISERGGTVHRTLKKVDFPASVSVMDNLDVTFQPNYAYAGQVDGGTISVRQGGKWYADVIFTFLTGRTRVVWK